MTPHRLTTAKLVLLSGARSARHKSSWWWLWQAVLTTTAGLVAFKLAIPVLGWVLFEAEWGVVVANLRRFALGGYPLAPLEPTATSPTWRPAAALLATALLLGASAWAFGPLAREMARLLTYAMATLVLAPAVADPLRSLGAGGLADLAAAVAPARPIFGLALAAAASGLVLAGRVDPAASPGRGRLRLRRLLFVAWPAAALGTTLLLVGCPGELCRRLHLAPQVRPEQWGGLLLTLFLAASALCAAFPMGVAIALGRRSSLPLVRFLCVGYVELIRGVPLVSLLFMTQVVAPLFLPPGPWLDRVLRAVVGFALFTAAYVAEDVRGGLSAVGTGQFDAARALGLSPTATYRLVVLPQALRTVVPSLVGQFIALFKDTSLVYIIGLHDLLHIAVGSVAQPEWRGLLRETLLFVAVIYFAFSFAVTRAGARLENPVQGARRRPRQTPAPQVVSP